MKVTLTETGGLMGRTKTATADWGGSGEEFSELIAMIKAKKGKAEKDGYAYFLNAGKESKEIPISIQNIPPELGALFDELFKNLRAP